MSCELGGFVRIIKDPTFSDQSRGTNQRASQLGLDHHVFCVKDGDGPKIVSGALVVHERSRLHESREAAKAEQTLVYQRIRQISSQGGPKAAENFLNNTIIVELPEEKKYMFSGSTLPSRRHGVDDQTRHGNGKQVAKYKQTYSRSGWSGKRSPHHKW